MYLSIATAGKVIWVLGVVVWAIIRRPHARRAKRLQVVSDRRTPSEAVGLAAGLLGLSIIPAIYVATGFPLAADYPPHLWAVALGAILLVCAMWVFRRTHKALGKNWSITLEIREKHKLISQGPYALVRHPMYTSFLLMGLGQAFLLSNWVAGLAGLLGAGILFFLRVDKEERMMLDVFGPEYQAYMDKTKRIIPYLY
ncbi:MULTISPECIES: protein-S-isoprenylcysteine O-methyltransferase [unclassified Rhizobium]|uniref:protein-S-isoprenylcysteine O-methyltransferase n=1 Tax=unclassified Rhizobium TaxID=2613769 RepID=UPI001A981CAD|nr:MULTISPECIES: protein-S-isoprenylcysteine O-methyltransferase [unclassified Rhizobium]MBX5156196.1 isoprenylcysteine carboxylmethyltransferase family protein [Rhizobium sp. NZLR8]MBX5165744.1 isoprenylcysteine carboxylmethyltransferase family protein [Rhizobium sp. NZLR4b]MBX5172101.1 isoprenylcysteine carboxylmethyltransferase family protein [Rhizobium sp. NZLR1b]MBX5184510.1 isoprenylcysteine carboxylmethyltransferase family protein [Rhizobium sp. NZLR5]MBX5191672.1 isoprenylcysteine carb